MPDLSQSPWSDIVGVIQESLLPILLIVVVAIVVIRLSGAFVHRFVKALMDREAAEGTAQELSAVELKKRIDTIESFASHTIQFFVVVIATLMILSELNVDIGPAIAGLGVLGIAVGFGAQTLVRDYLTGILILLENQFAKGDVVRIGGVSGVVEDFTLRRTTLRDVDGVVHIVPNGQILVASNLTRVWARIIQEVTIAYGTDIDRATAVVDAMGRDMAADPAWRRRIIEAPRVERVEALGESGVTLRISGTVRAADQWDAAGELRKRLLAAFRANGIEMPGLPKAAMATVAVGVGPGEDDLAPEE